MLTTTYSIMVLHGEQKKARHLLTDLEQHLDAEICNSFEETDASWLKQAFMKLAATYSYCRERKVERFIIPSVRDMAADAKTLFASLDFYAAYSKRILEYVHGQVYRALRGIQVDIATVVATMQLYCKQMAERFHLEEERLLPLACRVLSEDEWFQIASRCLSNVKNARCKCYQIHALKRRRADPRMLH